MRRRWRRTMICESSMSGECFPQADMSDESVERRRTRKCPAPSAALFLLLVYVLSVAVVCGQRGFVARRSVSPFYQQNRQFRSLLPSSSARWRRRPAPNAGGRRLQVLSVSRTQSSSSDKLQVGGISAIRARPSSSPLTTPQRRPTLENLRGHVRGTSVARFGGNGKRQLDVPLNPAFASNSPGFRRFAHTFRKMKRRMFRRPVGRFPLRSSPSTSSFRRVAAAEVREPSLFAVTQQQVGGKLAKITPAAKVTTTTRSTPSPRVTTSSTTTTTTTTPPPATTPKLTALSTKTFGKRPRFGSSPSRYHERRHHVVTAPTKQSALRPAPPSAQPTLYSSAKRLGEKMLLGLVAKRPWMTKRVSAWTRHRQQQPLGATRTSETKLNVVISGKTQSKVKVKMQPNAASSVSPSAPTTRPKSTESVDDPKVTPSTVALTSPTQPTTLVPSSSIRETTAPSSTSSTVTLTPPTTSTTVAQSSARKTTAPSGNDIRLSSPTPSATFPTDDLPSEEAPTSFPVDSSQSTIQFTGEAASDGRSRSPEVDEQIQSAFNTALSGVVSSEPTASTTRAALNNAEPLLKEPLPARTFKHVATDSTPQRSESAPTLTSTLSTEEPLSSTTTTLTFTSPTRATPSGNVSTSSTARQTTMTTRPLSSTAALVVPTVQPPGIVRPTLIADGGLTSHNVALTSPRRFRTDNWRRRQPSDASEPLATTGQQQQVARNRVYESVVHRLMRNRLTNVLYGAGTDSAASASAAAATTTTQNSASTQPSKSWLQVYLERFRIENTKNTTTTTTTVQSSIESSTEPPTTTTTRSPTKSSMATSTTPSPTTERATTTERSTTTAPPRTTTISATTTARPPIVTTTTTPPTPTQLAITGDTKLTVAAPSLASILGGRRDKTNGQGFRRGGGFRRGSSGSYRFRVQFRKQAVTPKPIIQWGTTSRPNILRNWLPTRTPYSSSSVTYRFVRPEATQKPRARGGGAATPPSTRPITNDDFDIVIARPAEKDQQLIINSTTRLDPAREDSLRQQIVDKHNHLRRHVLPSSGNMLKMKWHSEATQLAQKWANKCDFRHDNAKTRRTSRWRCGQNLARGFPRAISWGLVIQLWYDEVNDFHYGVGARPRNAAVGHYTQLVWAESFELGCAYKDCGQFHFYVCNYCPFGNLTSRKGRPYERGSECELCPGHCDNGLCTNYCYHKNKFKNCDSLEKKFQICSNASFNLKKDCQATCNCRGMVYS